MAYKSVSGIFLARPTLPNFIASSNTSFGSLLIDASGEKAAVVFRVPKSGTLESVGFRTNTVTTGDTLKVSFQDVSATDGNPDGVVDQFRTIVINSIDDNVWKETGIITSDGTDGGAKRTVTQGDLLAIVLEYNSYVSGNMNIGMMLVGDYSMNQAYHLLQTSGAWSKSGNYMSWALKYDDGSYAYIADSMPFSSLTNVTYNNGTVAQDEIALKFSNPFASKISGAWFLADLDGDTDIVLYDSDGTTVLASTSIDKDVRVSTSPSMFFAVFSSEITLSLSTFYRLSIKPTSSTNIVVSYGTVNSAAILDQMAGGQNYHYSSRVDAGAWTDVTTRRLIMGPMFSSLDDGVSAGGLKTHPGMSGGMRG